MFILAHADYFHFLVSTQEDYESHSPKINKAIRWGVSTISIHSYNICVLKLYIMFTVQGGQPEKRAFYSKYMYMSYPTLTDNFNWQMDKSVSVFFFNVLEKII